MSTQESWWKIWKLVSQISKWKRRGVNKGQELCTMHDTTSLGSTELEKSICKLVLVLIVFFFQNTCKVNFLDISFIAQSVMKQCIKVSFI